MRDDLNQYFDESQLDTNAYGLIDVDSCIDKNYDFIRDTFYKKALFIDPKFAEAWNNLGNAYGMKSEYHNARSCLR